MKFKCTVVAGPIVQPVLQAWRLPQAGKCEAVSNASQRDYNLNGKFVTHIGGETIEGIKNNKFSHTYFYSSLARLIGTRMSYAFACPAKGRSQDPQA